MKYLKYILLLLLLIPTIVFAKVNAVEVTSIELEEKSDNVEILEETTIEGSNLSFNNKFYEVNDYIKYSVLIKNVSGTDISIKDGNSVLESKYFSYEADLGSIEKIEKDEEVELILLIKYKKQVANEDIVSGKYLEVQNINIGMVDGELIISDTEIMDSGINPLTQDIIVSIFLVLLLSGILLFVLKKKKIAKYSLLLLFFIPIYINAINSIEVTSSVEVRLVKPNPCTYDGELVNGTYYQNGQYSYYYDATADGWSMSLTDKTSTEPVTTKMCTTINDKPIVSMSNTFSGSKATSIDLSSFDTSNVTNMFGMFSYATNVSELNLITFDTNNVTNMGSMFFNATGLTELDLHGFETPNLMYLSAMFYSCSGITELDLSNFDTNNTTGMQDITKNMTSLEKLDLSNWNFSLVNYENFFYKVLGNVPSLKSLTIDNTKFNKNMSAAFRSLTSLEELNAHNVDTSMVTDMSLLFENNNNLKVIDMSEFDTSNVATLYHAFNGMGNLEKVIFNGNVLNSSSPYYFVYMFSGTQVKEIDLEGATLKGNMSYAFNDMNLEKLNLKDVNTTEVTDMNRMFQNLKNVEELDVTSFDTSNVTNMAYMFAGDVSLKEIDITNFDTSKVTDMSWMFYNMKLLTEIDVSNIDLSSAREFGYMFAGTGLKKLDLSAWDVSGINNIPWGLIYETYSVEEVDISGWDMSHMGQSNMMARMLGGSSYAMSSDRWQLKKFILKDVILPSSDSTFSGFASVEEFVLDNVDTSRMTNMRGMFSGCRSIKTLDLSSFDTSNVTTMEDMFANDPSLVELDLSNFDTSKVTAMYGMFSYAESLKDLDISSFDTSNVTSMSSMFRKTSSLSTIDLSNFTFKTNVYLNDIFTETGATKVYVKSQEDADLLSGSSPSGLVFEVK